MRQIEPLQEGVIGSDGQGQLRAAKFSRAGLHEVDHCSLEPLAGYGVYPRDPPGGEGRSGLVHRVYGIEQERLNNLFGARLRITTLRAEDGPGLELLEYLSPRDGRPMPSDERSNDLVHWQTTLLTYDLALASKRIVEGMFFLISPGIVSTPSKELGFERGLLVRDPDGHVLQLVGR